MHNHQALRRRLIMTIFLLCLAIGLSACATSLNSLMPETAAPSGSSSAELEQLGDSLRERGELRMAFVQYEKALKLRPDNPMLIYKEGMLSLVADRTEDALKEFSKALTIDPGLAPACDGMGQAYFRKGEIEKAQNAFYKAVKLDPTLWNSWNKLGLIHDRQGLHKQAIQEYLLAIELRPRDGALYNNLGVSYTYNQEYDAAIAALNRAIDLNYTEKKVYNNLGLALGQTQRYDASLEAFRKAGSEAQAMNNLGVVYLIQNNLTKAIQSFEKAIELEPAYYVTAGENLKKARIALGQRQ